VPTDTYRNDDLQRPLLETVRQSQAAVLDVLRAWTDIGQRLTRELRLPVAASDVTGAVDRVFDLAEQSLAAQRQLAHTLAGVASRQVDTAVETFDSAVDTTVETVEAAVVERTPRIEVAPQPAREPAAQAQPAKREPAKQESKPDRRTYEERSIEELRERARELDIEGRSTMSKDELVAALRKRSR
jgi:Rho termination factor, N-terminal domain